MSSLTFKTAMNEINQNKVTTDACSNHIVTFMI